MLWEPKLIVVAWGKFQMTRLRQVLLVNSPTRLLLPLQSMVAFPQRVSTVQVGAEQNVTLLAEHTEDDTDDEL